MEAPKPKNAGKGPAPKPANAAKTPVNAPTAAPAPARVPPLFRKIDWITMLIAFGVVWFVYILTLAPEVTLEDSGELCTGAFYAGIPHPPGYPFWSIYSWFWSHILPINNVAWRVEMGESFGAAMACGLVALMVSRGSSMLIEGIDDLKELAGKRENVICMVCGAVAGILLGLGGVMWSESVAINRISLFGVPWVMLVMACMMRWIYAPHQLRFLFVAMFIFGICSTIHQTLLCAALGLEAAIVATRPRLGRTFFLGNCMVFLAGVMVHLTRMTNALDTAEELMHIYVAVGILSITAYIWSAIATKESLPELCRDAAMTAILLLLVASRGQANLYLVLTLVAVGAFVKFAYDTWKLGLEWLVATGCFILIILGASFYFYEAIAGMSDPPMQWGYPRTVEGFWHALSRGQYEKAHPTDLIGDPKRFIMQLGLLVSGITEEYNWVLLFVALVPLFFFFKMKKRERAWLIGVVGVYLCTGVLLVILMNPSDDKQIVDLHKVFFTSSHGLVAILLGYGLTLTTAFMVTNYKKFRILGLVLGSVALLPALIALQSGIATTFFGGAGLSTINLLILLFLTLAIALVLAGMAARMFSKTLGPPDPTAPDPNSSLMIYSGVSAVFLILSAFLAFFTRGGPSPGQLLAALPRAFSFKLANLPALAGVLVLGLVGAFIVSLFIRRERAPLQVMLAIFLLLPVSSVMSHWASSEQRGHWFGYWFGHDMFTPPFKGPDGQLTYDAQLREEAMKGTNGALIYPEMARNAILFGGTDPGRFCPTYIIFCESFIPHPQQPKQDQHFDRRDVYIITQNALADDTYLDYLRAQYNRSLQVDPPFFQELLRSDAERQQNYRTNFIARLAYNLLDKPFTKLGKRIEDDRRARGVYPPKEIYIPTPVDLGNVMEDYKADVQERFNHDHNPLFSNEAPLLKPGEAVPTPDGKGYTIGGASVMSLNGILTKVIFDHNRDHEFYVEESFPLDWMFPYLSPFGVIMKINHDPLDEITEEMVRRDHLFWSDYSQRLSGNWVTYDTSVKEIADFVEKVYVQHDFTGFTGNRRFMRDEQAQKSFSKLRVAIAGIYAFRLGKLVGTPTPEKYRAKEGTPEFQRVAKEADFAYRQAFAFCPFNPEVVFRYVQFLAFQQRYEEARTVAEICYRLDPNNAGVANLVSQLTPHPTVTAVTNAATTPVPTPVPTVSNLPQLQATAQSLEAELQKNPTNYSATLQLAVTYAQMQQGTKALETLNRLLADTNTDIGTLNGLANIYYKMQEWNQLETTFQRLTKLQPQDVEDRYNLARLQAALGQTNESLQTLRETLRVNDARRATNAALPDLRNQMPTDPNFGKFTNLPEFQQLLAPPK